jgi:DNA-binding Lrp family transcriptional regulator
MNLDSLDIRLLSAVQANNRVTAAVLAQFIPLSPSAITRRLQRLRAEGAFGTETATLSDALISKRVSAMLQIQLERLTSEGFNHLRADLMRRPEVQWCAEVSGAFDIIALITARSLAELNDLLDTLVTKNPNVRRAETSLVKRRWKATLAVPLDDRDIQD